MPEDHQTQLIRRIRFLERALAVNKPDYLEGKELYDAVIRKLLTMVENGEITTYLGVDSIYYHLLEKLEKGESDIDKYAEEIRDFIS